MKKIFIISAVLLVIVLLFLGIYNFSFKKESSSIQQPLVATPETPEKIVAIKKEKITAISDGAVLGPVVDRRTEEITYYDAVTGLVWKMDSVGQKKQQISNTKVTGLKNVFWSPDHSKVLTTVLKDGQTSFFMYDNLSQKGTLLKNGLDTAVWDNMGAKILYKYFDEASKKRTLNVANPDGSGWQKIADIAIRNLSIAPIPLTSSISYWNMPNASEETQLQSIGVTGGEPKVILSGRYGADYLWSPDGSRALISSLSEKGGRAITLGTVSISGEYKSLGIPTLVSKCAWSQDGKKIYYALPGGIPDGSIMPNDYQENKFNTNDTFWSIDIATGEKERVVEVSDINGKFDSINMFLSATEDALYFINRLDQKLYRIQL